MWLFFKKKDGKMDPQSLFGFVAPLKRGSWRRYGGGRLALLHNIYTCKNTQQTGHRSGVNFGERRRKRGRTVSLLNSNRGGGCQNWG